MWLTCRWPDRKRSALAAARRAMAMCARPSSRCSPTPGGRSNGWCVTMMRSLDAGTGASRRTIAATCVRLIRPSPHAHERAVFIADDDHLVVFDDRFQLGRDVPLVAAKGRNEPGRDVPQRHVVIARDDQERPIERVQEPARLEELAVPCPLREIARHRHEIGRGVANRGSERCHDSRVEAPHVDIGQMDDRAHLQGSVRLRAQGLGVPRSGAAPRAGCGISRAAT